MAFITNGGLIQYGATNIECQSITVNHGAKQIALRSGGTTPQTFVVLNNQPSITFQTHDVGKLLAASMSFGINSLAANTVVAWSATPLNFGIYGTANKATVTAGALCINSLNLSDGDLATVTATIYPCSSDGSTDPIAFASGTIPTLTETVVGYTLNGASLNGTAIADVKSVSLDTGHDVFFEATSGARYPTTCFLRSYAPVVTVSGYSQLEMRSLITSGGLWGNGTTGMQMLVRGTTSGVVSGTVYTITIKRGQAIMGELAWSTGATDLASFTYNAAKLDDDTDPIAYA